MIMNLNNIGIDICIGMHLGFKSLWYRKS